MSEATLGVWGTAQATLPATLLTVTVNGSPAPLTPGGAFTTQVSFVTTGTQTIVVRAVDSFGMSGQAQVTGTYFSGVVPSTVPPQVALTFPVEGQYLPTGSLTVRGTVTASNPLQKVEVNGVPATLYANNIEGAAVFVKRVYGEGRRLPTLEQIIEKITQMREETNLPADKQRRMKTKRKDDD